MRGKNEFLLRHKIRKECPILDKFLQLSDLRGVVSLNQLADDYLLNRLNKKIDTIPGGNEIAKNLTTRFDSTVETSIAFFENSRSFNAGFFDKNKQTLKSIVKLLVFIGIEMNWTSYIDIDREFCQDLVEILEDIGVFSFSGLDEEGEIWACDNAADLVMGVLNGAKQIARELDDFSRGPFAGTEGL